MIKSILQVRKLDAREAKNLPRKPNPIKTVNGVTKIPIRATDTKSS